MLATRAQEIVGVPHLLTDADTLAAYAVEGVRPAAVARPHTAEDTAALLAAAADAGAAVLPWGGGAHQGWPWTRRPSGRTSSPHSLLAKYCRVLY